MNKKIIYIVCYVLLPWIFIEMNQIIMVQARAVAQAFTHIVWVQTVFPILYAINLTLFLCVLAFLFYKILRTVKYYSTITILGVLIYPLGYYLVFLLSYIGVRSAFINFAMKITPSLYSGSLSLPILIAMSFLVIIVNVMTNKDYWKKESDEQ